MRADALELGGEPPDELERGLEHLLRIALLVDLEPLTVVVLPEVGEVEGAMVNVGNPHFVLFVETDDFSAHGMRWQQLGEKISASPLFPYGTNVEFVRLRSKGPKDVLSGPFRSKSALADARLTELLDVQASLEARLRHAPVEELSANGALNLAGLQGVIGLRTQFGYPLPMGNDVARFYDVSYYSQAAGLLPR